jgi:catechol 2,3-dioxygenase-like lactoylglutathione lyase family enzyme
MIGFEHTCISVSDLERSIEFYKKLGFKILRKAEGIRAIMFLGNDIIEIIPKLDKMKKDGFTPPFPFHIGFHSDDLEKDVALLHEQGIETGPVVHWVGERLEKSLAEHTQYAEPAPEDPKLLGCMMPSEEWKGVLLKDPDGIVLEIWQRQ